MAVVHFRILLAALASGSLLGITACSESDTSAPTERLIVGAPALISTDPLLNAPPIRACYRLEASELSATTSERKAVDCTSRHTTVTYAVSAYPEELRDSSADRATHARTACTKALPQAVGIRQNDLPGAAIASAWFEPTALQRAAGAHWFRCDLHSEVHPTEASRSASHHEAIAALPRANDTLATLPLFDDALPAAWRRCIQPSTEDATQVRYLTCDKPHRFAWAGAISIDEASYPGAQRWRAIAEQRCRSVVGNAALWFTYPRAEAWADGERLLSCYRDVR